MITKAGIHVLGSLKWSQSLTSSDSFQLTVLPSDAGGLPSLSLLEGEDDQGHGILLLCVRHKQTVLADELLAGAVDSQNLGAVGAVGLAPGFRTSRGG